MTRKGKENTTVSDAAEGPRQRRGNVKVYFKGISEKVELL